MAVFRTKIRSDLQKPLVVQQLSGNMFTADNASNEIAVEVTNGGAPVALSGAVTAYAVRADGVTAMFSGTINGNVASVILPATCYTKAGTLSIVVKVGSNTVGACTCYVYRTTTDEIVDPGHVIPSIEELLGQIEACRTATANANTAATNANAAASNANTKAALANEKATLADQKATLANTAAQNADTKASLADTAATNANTKAGLANDAAALANTKAALADEKATLADTKATLANTAATNANTKAGLADTAAQNADDKATLANDAATLANTKAGLANTAATTANTAAGKINNMTVAATGLPEGSAPIATISEVGGHKHIAFQIPKGDKGKDFRIAKTFASIAAMMAYTGTDLEKYDFAMIDTGSVEDPDTGKLYCYEPEKNPKWSYIGDLSGAQGIKGETGTGIDHVSLNADYTLTIYYDDGTSDTTASIRGATGITPAISIGSVTTLSPNQQAYAELDQTSTPEAPVINFGIPKGETGAIENLYASAIPMSQQDSTRVDAAINGKASKVSGATDGNLAGLDVNGNLTDSGKSADDFLDKKCESGWKAKTLSGLANIEALYVWTDGENIYYSKYGSHYVLDKATFEWTRKVWNGYTDFSGKCIWSDGENIYYSSGGTTIVLDKSTSTWSIKYWNNFTYNLDGDYIWTDGENYYYSRGTAQYVLDKANDTWVTKTWNGLTNFDGVLVWTDGNDIYHTAGTSYVLDKATSTWSVKTWSGMAGFGGSGVWSDGENIYYNSTKVLDRDSSTWEDKSWNGLDKFYSENLWTDGENIYCSRNNSNYILDNKPKLYLGQDGIFEAVSAKKFLEDNVPTPDFSNKTDKVVNATDGNFAGLDANGNLTDSGIASGDVATKEDVNSTQDGIAIVAVGDTHVVISSGQFVFIRSHPTLAKGMYKAKAAIAANGALSTSNLTADDSGGLNDLQSQVTALNSNIPKLIIRSRKGITQSTGNDFWTVDDFPQISGYSRQVLSVNPSADNIIVVRTVVGTSNLEVHTRNIATASVTFDLTCVCAYMPD